MRKKLLLFIGCTLLALSALAQIVEPIHWKESVVMTDDTRGVFTLTATIDDDWHLYALQLPDGGPVPTSVSWDKLEGVKLIGKITPDKKAHQEHDRTFDMDLQWWTQKVTLQQQFEVTDRHYAIEGTVRFMACNDQTCTAPATHDFKVNGKTNVVATEPAANADSTVADSLTPALSVPEFDTWAPVEALTQGPQAEMATTSTSALWYIFWACFGAGLLALLTPCVWPIIPMTVSFFLKKSGSRGKSIKNALLYGASIVVIYVALGLLVTAAFGPNKLNAIATSAVCNIAFFLLLVIFAISFFGAFEIQLPASWSTRMDNAANNTTGLLSIFFMAFTLTIVSFSCTGPIIGTLLVEAANQGDRLAPALGMLGFALALAIPFSLFALFPSWLKKLPRSGSWLNTVKVVLGFIELALSLKFLSVADLAYGWHILDREIFLALWIAIFALLGFYLLGMIRLKSDGEKASASIGITRLMLGLASLAFTAYLLPGLWGAPLRGTSAFVPPLYTQDFNLYGDEAERYNDYDAGMAAALRSGKPVFLDFSGYGCVNCRKMDGAVLDRDEVKNLIRDRFVSIELMVDDKQPLPTDRYVEENGKQVRLRTQGDLWSYLQRHKFGANSQPYYVVLDAQGHLKSGPFAYREDVPAFVEFLNKGLE